MSYQKINMEAGVPYRVGIAGKMILIDDIGLSNGVDVRVLRQGTPDTVIPKRKAAFRMITPYDDVLLTTNVNTTIGVFLSEFEVELGYVDRAAVTIPDGVRVNSTEADPVYTRLSAPINIGDVRVNNTNAQAIPVQKQALSVIVDGAVVPIGSVRAALVSDATLKILRIRNGDVNGTLYLGGAGVTALNAAVVLAPGDMWEEQSAAGAAWFAVSDGPTISVKIQGIK